MALTEKIKQHIEQNEELHNEKEAFTAFTEKLFGNLKQSSGTLNDILSSQDIEEKERQLKCYNLGMTVQQSTRALIESYITSFNHNHQ